MASRLTVRVWVTEHLVMERVVAQYSRTGCRTIRADSVIRRHVLTAKARGCDRTWRAALLLADLLRVII